MKTVYAGSLLLIASLSNLALNAAHSGNGNGMDQMQMRLTQVNNLKVYSLLSKGQATDTSTSYRFYIQGGLHGNEKLTTDFVLWMMDRVQNGASPLNHLNLEYGASFDFVPTANSYGYKNNARYNENAVNLNRNFDVLWGVSRENPGFSSFSEAETQGIQALFDKNRYLAAVDVHGYAKMLVAPSDLAKIASGNQNISRAISISDEKNAKYQQWFAALNKGKENLAQQYEVKTAYGLGDGGAFEDWAFWQKDVYSYCLEMHSNKRFSGSPLGTHSTNIANTEDSYIQYEKLIYENFLQSIYLEQKFPSIKLPDFKNLVNGLRKSFELSNGRNKPVH